jgi:hypothetical protein
MNFKATLLFFSLLNMNIVFEKNLLKSYLENYSVAKLAISK